MDAEMKRRAAAYVEAHFDELCSELGALVAIPSVARPGADGLPYGRECARALDAALDLARRHELSAENHDDWYGTAAWGSGPFHVGIFTHLDVVEAGDGWLYPPYQCTERDGWLIGRGVGDDKLAAVVAIHALRAARELNLAPDSRFTVFFGCCEEKGMSDLDRYLAEQVQPDLCLVPDIRFPVCVGEKGTLRFSLSRPLASADLLRLSGGSAPNVVPAGAEALLAPRLAGAAGTLATGRPALSVEAAVGGAALRASGRASSASMPQKGSNAVGLLTAALAGWEALSGADRELMARCAALSSAWDGRALGVTRSDEASGALTCTCVGLAGGAGALRLSFDLRYPVTHSGGDIAGALARFARAEGWTLEGLTDSRPLNVPRDDPAAALLFRCWEEATGRRGEPFVIGGGTYARKLRRALGFGPDDGSSCPFLPEGHGAIHGPDEARSLRTVREALATYLCALHVLDRNQRSL